MYSRLLSDPDDSSLTTSRQLSLHTSAVQNLSEMGFNPDFIEIAINYTNSTNIEELLAFLIKGDNGWEHEFIPNELNRCEICKDIAEEHINSHRPPPFDAHQRHEEIKSIQDRFSFLYSQEDENEIVEQRCEICLYSLQDPWSLPSCTVHSFCKPCIVQYIEILISESKVLHIKCPGNKCLMEFTESDIKDLVTQEIFIKYLKFKERSELLLDPEIKWCIQPDCEGYVRGTPKDTVKTCPKCEFKLCFRCGKAWHPKKSCDQVIDADYELWAQGKEIQLCPKCKHRIEKIDGCNHMTCAICSYNWCWLCRGRYTSNHFNALNPFGCARLQGGFNTRERWPLWKIYLNRCKGICLWLLIILLFPLIILFGPAFIIVRQMHTTMINHEYSRPCVWITFEICSFIGIVIVTLPGYALALPILIIVGLINCYKRI